MASAQGRYAQSATRPRDNELKVLLREHIMSKKLIRPTDDAVVELLHEDPAFAEEHLSAALDEINQPGGHEVLLATLRHIAKAQG